MSRQSIFRPSTAPSTPDPRFAASVRKSGSNELLSDVDSKFAASALKKIPSRGSLTELEQVRASLGEGKLRHLSKPWSPPPHYGNFQKPSSRLLDDEIAASGVLAKTADEARMERHKFDGEKNRAYIMARQQEEMQRQQKIQGKKAQAASIHAMFEHAWFSRFTAAFNQWREATSMRQERAMKTALSFS